MDYLEQRRKLRQMVQERLDYGRDYTDEENNWKRGIIHGEKVFKKGT